MYASTLIAATTAPQTTPPVRWEAHEKLRNKDVIAAMHAAIKFIPSEHLREPETGEYYSTHELAVQ